MKVTKIFVHSVLGYQWDIRYITNRICWKSHARDGLSTHSREDHCSAYSGSISKGL